MAALSACAPPRDVTPALALHGDATAGRAQYQIVCAACHGPEGTGIAGAPGIATTVAGLSDEAVLTTVLRGRGGMPAAHLTDAQAADILAYLRATWGGGR
jgi:mono/diheme cytochrome c family protein